ncbi:MAG: ABC transporter permease [Prevotellaceae bacterium]|jgi:putative ABC transport system permease protein|nr:ABC transporter permease [Prevotellaceae bacterium]
MISLLYEILNTIRRNKMRTFLTGFAVAWGIFMLIVLLGSGNGLKNGFASNFGDRLMNVVQIWGGRTNIPYAGFQSGRRIALDEKDLQFTSAEFDKYVNLIAGNINFGTKTLSYGTEYLSSNLQGVSPNRIIIDGLKITQGNGRFINDLDIREKRKVIVISQRAKDILFNSETAIGKNVNFDGIIYTVVGVYYIEDRQDAVGSYIPLSTSQTIYNRGIKISNFAFTLNENIYDKATNDEFMNSYRKRIAQVHQVSPEDDNAIWYGNRFESYLQMANISKFINIAVWIIGIFTLLSGIVGVSNIMLITVRERTREFGIRKSIGASPFSILKLVIVESIFITTIFGYIGLVCGVGITEFASQFFEPSSAGRNSFNAFLNPTVDINVAVQATLLLIIAGTLAGFFPALKAVQIKTIEALNNK